MPPLLSTLLPSSHDKRLEPSDGISNGYNYLLKLTNDQLFQLLRGYANSELPNAGPKLIVKNGKIEIKINDTTILNTSQLNESNMDIYSSLPVPASNKSPISVNLGSINSRLSIQNNSNNSKTKISPSEIETLSNEFEEVDLRLQIINIIASKKEWCNEAIINELQSKEYPKGKGPKSSLIDKIIEDVTDESGRIKNQYVNLVRLSSPGESSDDLNQTLDKLDYPANHPMRLMITNDISSLDLSPKVYSPILPEIKRTPQSQIESRPHKVTNEQVIVSSDEDQDRCDSNSDGSHSSSVSSAVESPSSYTSNQSSSNSTEISSSLTNAKKRTISSASTSSTSSTNSMESVKRSKSRSPLTSYDEDDDEEEAQQQQQLIDTKRQPISPESSSANNDNEPMMTSNKASSQPPAEINRTHTNLTIKTNPRSSTPITIYKTNSNSKVSTPTSISVHHYSPAINKSNLTSPIKQSSIEPQLKPIPKQPRSMSIQKLQHGDEEIKDSITKFNTLYVDYYTLYQELSNQQNKDELKLKKLLRLHNTLTSLRWKLYNPTE